MNKANPMEEGSLEHIVSGVRGSSFKPYKFPSGAEAIRVAHEMQPPVSDCVTCPWMNESQRRYGGLDSLISRAT